MIKINLIIILLLTGCSFAPLTSHHTANPLGKGTSSLKLGLSPLPVVSYSRGMGQQVDLNLFFEYQLVPIVGGSFKFSLGKQGPGSNLAVSLGASGNTTSKAYYSGIITSYRSQTFEPYFNFRYNYVTWDSSKIESEEDKLNDFFSKMSKHFHYYQAIAGLNIWFSKTFGLNLNAKILLDEDFKATSDDNSVIPSLNLVWEF